MAGGSALFHEPETLFHRALEVVDYACCRLKNVNDLGGKCPPEPNFAGRDAGTQRPSSLTSIDQKVENVQSIAETVKATLDVFGSHSLSMTVTCAHWAAA